MINNKRALVMECSVAIEQMISKQICYLMDIDRNTSKLFGVGSSTLSFNQKVEFLTEVKYFNKQQREKLNRFAEIRNKFAHLAEITSFSNCFNSIQGLLTKLKIWFPEIEALKNIVEEDKFGRYFDALYNDIISDVRRFVRYYNDRLEVRYSLEVKADNYDALINAMLEIGKQYHEPLLDEFVKKSMLKAAELFEALDKKRAEKKTDHKILP